MAKDKVNIVDDGVLRDTELERSFLLTIMNDAYSDVHFKDISTYLIEDDFTVDEHAKIWKYICKCRERGETINFLNVFAYARKDGEEINFARYVSLSSSSGDEEIMAKTIHYLGQKRRIGDVLLDVMMSLHVPDFTPEQAVAQMEGIIKDTVSKSAIDVDEWKSVTRDIMQYTEDKANGKIPQGAMCGFKLIDGKGGFEPGELCVVAGRNSNGKTSLALCFALGIAQRGVPVGIFSLEMTNRQLGTRLISMLSGVDGENIKRATMDQSEWEIFLNSAGNNETLPIYFDKKRNNDADSVMAAITAMVSIFGVRVILIDYLQLLVGKERERMQQVAAIANRLKSLAVRLDITIILLSQLRRNSNISDPTPHMEELKESGDIENAADSIYLIYRPERHGPDAHYPDMTQSWSKYDTKGTGLLMCAKNRTGKMDGEQLLGFDARTTRFYEKDDFAEADFSSDGGDFDEYLSDNNSDNNNVVPF